MNSKHCYCPYCKENIDKVNAPILFFHNRFHKPYTGKTFEYCPWCGQALAECSETDYEDFYPPLDEIIESATRKDER